MPPVYIYNHNFYSWQMYYTCTLEFEIKLDKISKFILKTWNFSHTVYRTDSGDLTSDEGTFNP